MAEDGSFYEEDESIEKLEEAFEKGVKVTTDLPWRDVAVVVFARTQGVDYHDAAYIAQRAISDSLIKDKMNSPTGYTMSVPINFRDQSRVVEIHKLMEVGMAAGNGYLWTEPTKKAYPRLEDDEG